MLATSPDSLTTTDPRVQVMADALYHESASADRVPAQSSIRRRRRHFAGGLLTLPAQPISAAAS